MKLTYYYFIIVSMACRSANTWHVSDGYSNIYVFVSLKIAFAWPSLDIYDL